MRDMYQYVRRLYRLHQNRKHRQRDRFKPKPAKKLLAAAQPKYRRWRWWVREVTRRPTAPETGYGVAYEKKKES